MIVTFPAELVMVELNVGAHTCPKLLLVDNPAKTTEKKTISFFENFTTIKKVVEREGFAHAKPNIQKLTNLSYLCCSLG